VEALATTTRRQNLFCLFSLLRVGVLIDAKLVHLDGHVELGMI
jgi:hypothetical protein